MTPAGIVSNTPLENVRDAVRLSALQSFAYFANSVLGGHLDDDFCWRVQNVVSQREDIFIETASPRRFASLLQGWLSAQGYDVLSTVPATRHEVLEWLQLPEGEATQTVEVTLRSNGVSLQWL